MNNERRRLLELSDEKDNDMVALFIDYNIEDVKNKEKFTGYTDVFDFFSKYIVIVSVGRYIYAASNSLNYPQIKTDWRSGGISVYFAEDGGNYITFFSDGKIRSYYDGIQQQILK